MTMHHAGLAEVVRKDPRFAIEAYEFVFAALYHTQKLMGRQPREVPGEGPGEKGEVHYHVTGRELVFGIRDLALREFGLLARTVFRMWGISKTDDFGDIVFNLVESNLMSKTNEDSRADFHEVFDLDQALVKDYRIQLEDGPAD
jgi:uncharacterized repeat protein (TIGR04138 family)